MKTFFESNIRAQMIISLHNKNGPGKMGRVERKNLEWGAKRTIE